MLAAPAPNPFRTTTVIRFAAPRRGRASLRFYDVAGRLVRTLHDGWLEAGQHVRVWDRRNEQGGMSRAGVYFYRFDADGVEGTRSVVRKAALID